MSAKLRSHLISLVLVTLTATLLIYLYHQKDTKIVIQPDENIRPYLAMEFLDYNDPFQQALFKDMLVIYQTDKQINPETVVRSILSYKQDVIESEMRSVQTYQPLNLKKLTQIGIMYLKFILIYVIVLMLTYYGVETLGILRFIRKKQGKISYIFDLIRLLQSSPPQNWKTYQHILSLLVKAAIRGVFYLIFFSPAYVLAYSFKTKFDTNTIVFLAILGLVSNGLLITYTNKFFSFLIAESRKGYVLTARVKNMFNIYNTGKADGVSLKALFAIRKQFRGHVLHHIYLNAHFQYLGTIKEQASFLISGLIIIEMALNIHGHLSYELLQQLLYKNYDIVIVIILLIFFMVKITQIGTDWVISKKIRAFNNEE